MTNKFPVVLDFPHMPIICMYLNGYIYIFFQFNLQKRSEFADISLVKYVKNIRQIEKK